MFSSFAQSKSEDDLIVVDLTQDLTRKTDMKLSDIAKNITYTKLESKEGSFIRQFRKYSITDDYILVYDRTQGLVFLFNRDGSFIKRISSIGNGPGEYNRLNDVRISSCEKYILIHHQKDIKKFDFEGNFLGNTRIPSIAMYVDTYEDGLIGMFPSTYSIRMNSFSLVTFDWEGNITGQYGKRNWDWFSSGMPMKRPRYYRYENNVCFFEDYYDTVYSLNSNREIKPRIYFKSAFDAAKKRQNIKITPEYLREMKGFFLSGWLEAKNFIFISGPYKSKLHPLIFDKKSNEVFHIPFDSELGTSGIPNDLDGGSPFWASRYQDDKLYRLEYANRLKLILDNELIDNANFTDQELRDKLMEFRSNLSEDDGLILIEIQLK